MATKSEGSETTAYSWDTLEELPELAVETTSKKSSWHFEIKDSRSYTYGEGPIGIEAGRDTITFHTDSLGSIVQLSDDKGRLLQSYRYSPFGGDYSPTSALNAKSDDLSPIRFTGQYLDSETDLYNMRAREYDPETARFLETDPVSCEEGGACGSVYVYVDDRPTVDTDPSGMCPVSPEVGKCEPGWRWPKMAESIASDIRNNRRYKWTGNGMDPRWQAYAAYAPLPRLRIRALDEAKSWLTVTEGSRDHEKLVSWYGHIGSDDAWCAVAVSRWYVSAGSRLFSARTDRFQNVGNISGSFAHINSPLPGDIVTYSSAKNDQRPNTHTGIIKKVMHRNPDVIRTIEGNTSNPNRGPDGVFEKTRTFGVDFATFLYLRVPR